MIRHIAEVFVLLLAAFALGTAGGIGLRILWHRRAARIEPQPVALPVAVPLSVAPSISRPKTQPAPPPAALAPPAARLPSPARALVPAPRRSPQSNGQRPAQQPAKAPGTALARISTISPASIDGRRLFQEHLKAATERRETTSELPPATPPGTALARPLANSHLREIDLTAIRRQPQRPLLAPSRPIAKTASPSLPILLPALHPDEAWNDEPARPPSPPALRPKVGLRDIGDADDPWESNTAGPVDLPVPRPTAVKRLEAGPRPLPLSRPATLKPAAPARSAGLKRPAAPAGLPTIAAPRSDQIWIEAARADAGLPAQSPSAPTVRATYRTDGRRPPRFDIAPAVRDNLRRIRGVGQGFEKRLNELGIYKFSQIAAWTEPEQQWISDQLGFPGRVERDDWPSQAARLLQRRQQPGAGLVVDAEIASDP
jgi:predicted flap endonuclease-1-like 5' DNA nuclease